MRRVRAARRAERNGHVPSHSNLVLGGRGQVGVEAGAVVGEELPPGFRHVGGRGERKSEHALIQEDGEVEGPDPHRLDGVPHSGHIHIHSAGSLGGEQHLGREHLVDDGQLGMQLGMQLRDAIRDAIKGHHHLVTSIWSTMGQGSAPSVELEPQSRRRSHVAAIREAIREALREAIKEPQSGRQSGIIISPDRRWATVRLPTGAATEA